MDEDERPAETHEDPDLGSMHSSGFEEYAGFSPAVAGAIPHWGGVMDLNVISEEEYVPMCMIHGTDDTTVPYDSGYCFNGILPNVMPYMYGSHPIAYRLDELGITDYEFHPFEGEEHAFYYTILYQLDEEKFNACFSIVRDFLYHHLDFSTSVAEWNEQCIQVYPNPATSQVTIHSLQDKPYSLVVTDLLGRTILSENHSSSESTIDVSRWPSGVYVIRIEQEEGVYVRKFVKH